MLNYVMKGAGKQLHTNGLPTLKQRKYLHGRENVIHVTSACD